MPTREAILDYIDTAYSNAHTYYHLAKTELFWAKQNFGIASDHDVLGAVCDGCYYLYISAGQLNTFADPIGGRGQLPYFLRYFTIDEAPDFDLTMDDLINAMLLADPDHIEYFVGLVDAYRQSIWNRPYNHEFFAALGRGFEQWR